MADDESIEDELDADDDELEEDLVDEVEEDLEDDLVADTIVVGEVAGDDLEEAEDPPVKPAGLRPVRDRSEDEEEEEDDDEADPDDVEEDLDTILRDRIKAGEDDDDEEDEEDVVVDDRTESGDRVAPRAAEEISCPECFLLVRRSQFSSRRTDCPGGLDGQDCPMMDHFS